MMTLAGRWRRQGIAVDFATLAATPTIDAWTELVTAGAPSARYGKPRPPIRRGPAGRALPAGTDAARHVGRQARQPAVRRGGRAPLCRIRRGPDRSRTPARRGHGAGAAPSDAARGLPARRHPAHHTDARKPGLPRRASRTCATRLDAERRLAAVREAKSHQQLDGAVFELALTLLPRPAVTAARRFGHAGRRRDELPHPDGRPGGPVPRA